MRISTTTLLGTLICMALAAPVLQADVYKYRDRSGHVLLTDRPVRGMKLLKRYAIETGRHSAPAPAAGQALTQMNARRDALAPLIEQAAQAARLRPELVHAVVRAESAYRDDAVSPKGAVGLMQLMPATAERYGVSDRSDPAQNLSGGTRYLSDLLDLFDDDLQLALAAYNAGENAVIRHGRKIPPYTETRDYVRKVLAFYNELYAADRLALR